MDWEHVRVDWQSRSGCDGECGLSRPTGLSRLWRHVRWRDGLETGVAIVLVIFFGWVFIRLLAQGVYLPALFALWLTLVCTYIPLKLSRSRSLIPRPHPEMPVIDYLRAEREALQRQRDMLCSLWRWYWGPIAVGVVGLFVGIRGLHWLSAVYTAVVVAVSLVIEFANRMAVRKRFDPAMREIENQIRQMEEDNTD